MPEYHGRITARTMTEISPVNRAGQWTCDHAHRLASAAFECAVVYAKRWPLKSQHGKQSAVTGAGFRELTITVTEVTSA